MDELKRLLRNVEANCLTREQEGDGITSYFPMLIGRYSLTVMADKLQEVGDPRLRQIYPELSSSHQTYQLRYCKKIASPVEEHISKLNDR